MKLDFKKRPLSWSAISSFQYNPEQWYKKYILGERQPENAPMTFGKIVGDRIRFEPDYLKDIVRPVGGTYEYELRFKVGKIETIGFIDFFHEEKRLLQEYKTGKVWDKERADNHGQLKMYALGLMVTKNIRPEDLTIQLVSMETEARGDFTMTFVKNMKPIIHEVKLTTKDCLMFGAEVIKITKEMQKYVDNALAYNLEDSRIKEVNLIK